MKPIVILLLLISIVCVFILVIKPPAKITIHVVSDNGISIPNLPINLSTFNYWKPGEGFGTDIDSVFSGITDSKGMVTFTILSERGDMAFGTVSGLIGYYPGGGKYQFKNVYGGVNWRPWRPWNPTVELILKPIKNPIPMYARSVGVMGSNLTLPAKNTPIGFDLVAADFVSPYGQGTVTDFIFNLSDKDPTDYALTLSFSHKGDGIQSVLVSQNQGSFFRMLSDAPQTGYEETLVQKHSQLWVHGLLQENQNYFYRVRTVLDGSGNVKSALYGKIRGPIQFWDNAGLEFTYYLNPTPNDRNMEFDPSKNLLQNLTDDQQVKAP